MKYRFTAEGALGDLNTYISRISSDLHNCQDACDVRELLADYKRDGRLMVMTGWLVRTRRSVVDSVLPLLKKDNPVLKELKDRLKLLIDDAQAVATSLNPNARPLVTNLHRFYQRAKAWKNAHGWPRGENFNPSTTIYAWREVVERGSEPEWFYDIYRRDKTPYDQENRPYKTLSRIKIILHGTMKNSSYFIWIIVTALLSNQILLGQEKIKDKKLVEDQHAQAGIQKKEDAGHTLHPDAQWFPDAGMGLFLHWGISSVKSMNISWPMIPGRALAKVRITDVKERERIMREKDFNLDKHPIAVTPNQYWEMAKEFNPDQYNPHKWAKAAKDAGFKYVVLTTKHHEGFAMWPSEYGNFNTSNYMGGKDLLLDYVKACRAYGLKIGFYYSGGDWWYEKDRKNFMYYKVPRVNPEFPELDANLDPRPKREYTEEETRNYEDAYKKLVRGQITELLTRYGKIDILWFDGPPKVKDGKNTMLQEEMRALQPGIVINPRFHGKGDFKTYERNLKTNTVETEWAEFCDPWNGSWPHVEQEFRADAYVIASLIKCRALNINYLIGVGPMASGELSEEVYERFKVLGAWVKKNKEAIDGTAPLPSEEKTSGYATAKENVRYLFAIRDFANERKDDGDFNVVSNALWNVGKYEKDLLPLKEVTLVLENVSRPKKVYLLENNVKLPFSYENNKVTITLPVHLRSILADVVKVCL